MPSSQSRHARQARLAEVGERGQAVLAASTAVVKGEGLAAEVEARYLAGAGVGTLIVGAEAVARVAREADPSVHVEVRDVVGDDPEAPVALGLESAAAMALATGAYRALVRVCALLEGP